MANESEEATFHAEWAALLTAFHETKANKEADPEAWKAAKYALHEFRTHWRHIRRYNLELALAGDEEAMARALAEVGEGGAVVSPAPVGLTSTQQEG
jgi:hypothetical protein